MACSSGDHKSTKVYIYVYIYVRIYVVLAETETLFKSDDQFQYSGDVL